MSLHNATPVEYKRALYAKKTRSELIAIIQEYIPYSHEHIAAKQLIDQMDRADEERRHRELIEATRSHTESKSSHNPISSRKNTNKHTMPVTRLFIGSSGAAKSQAKAIVKAFSSPTLQFLPWWDDAFVGGGLLLENLEKIKDKVDGAVFVFSPEIPGAVRKANTVLPNQNVLFEFGYFLGHFGHGKVCMMKYGDYYLPSDFGGYIHITGSGFFRPGAVTKLGKRTAKEFGNWIANF